MPHPLIGAQILHGSLNVGQFETHPALWKAAERLGFREKPFSLRNEDGEPSPMLALVGRRGLLQDHLFILRIPEQPDGLKPSDQVLNDAVTSGEVVFGVEIDHQPDCLPPRGFCGLIHDGGYRALGIVLLSTCGRGQNDFRPNFRFGSRSVAGTVGIESLFGILHDLYNVPTNQITTGMSALGRTTVGLLKMNENVM